MADQLDDMPHNIGDVTGLLSGHARLIGETSEKLALDLMAEFRALGEILSRHDEDTFDPSAFQERMDAIYAALQVQDFLRQQVEVLQAGLSAVSVARVPEGENPEAWLADRLKEIEETYVMQAQFDLHAEVVGDVSEATVSDQGAVFF